MGLMICTEGFHTHVGGVPETITVGEVFEDDDEIVRRFPMFFRSKQARFARPEVEAASAAPGELRGEKTKR